MIKFMNKKEMALPPGQFIALQAINALIGDKFGGCNPFLDWLVWFIKKSKQFNQSHIVSDIVALTLTLSVNGSLSIEASVSLSCKHTERQAADLH